MKITKPNITEGKWYVAIESVSFTTIRSSNQKNHHRDYLCRVDDGLGVQLKERQSNAKAISAVPDMIDELISDYEAFEWMYEHTNETAIADYCHDKMESIKKTLIKLGCTYEH